MKHTLYFWLIVIAASNGFASVVIPGQVTLLGRFTAGLEQAKTQGKIVELKYWSDIESLPLNMQERMLGSSAQDRPNVSDYFVIIPKSERAKFPKGNLLIISASPFNQTAWYREWYAKSENYTPEQLADFDRFNPKDEIIRWYVVENEEGQFERMDITEEELSKIITQTGLTIPSPVKYRFNMAQVDPATGKPINAPSSLPTPAATSSSVNTLPSSSPVVVHPSPVPQNAKSSNPLWWIISIIAALCAVGLFIWRKRSKN